MLPQWIIEKKRDGIELSNEEITHFVNGFTNGTIPEYQMSALAMAIYFKGMTPRETATLTNAMAHTGDLISFDGWHLPTADKHSTGGIGDKLSLIIAPLAAAAGLAVPKMSGRGLGHTGGTLDKLESIPGYSTSLSIDEFKRIVADVGCSLTGQTAKLVPADRKLYALRDVTGTVPSIPLITASIMSKKIADGASIMVFDVKCGNAAFMRTKADAQELARSMISVARQLNRRAAALITTMDQPLGRAVGNSLEVIEALEVLRGKGSPDVRQLSLELTALMTTLSGITPNTTTALQSLATLLDNGEALDRFYRMVTAHGGNTTALDNHSLLPQPGAIIEVPAPETGYIDSVNALAIGRLTLQLGGGRRIATDTIDLAAGVDHLVKQGESVQAGAPLMRLHTKDHSTAQALIPDAISAVKIVPHPPTPSTLILDQITTE